MALADLNKSPRCQHVHYSGRPCKAPARRGRNYCLFHQAAHFDAGGCVLPLIEDSHSYQLAVIRVARALADDAITPQKATAMLYALQLAGWNLKQFVEERKDIEDPEAAESRNLLARFLSLRLRQAGKFPTPTDEEVKELLSHPAASASTAPDPAAAPPAVTEPGDPEPGDSNVNEGAPHETEPGIILTAAPPSPEGTDAGSPPRSAGNTSTNTPPVPEGRTDPPKPPSLAEFLLDRLNLIEPDDPNQPKPDNASDAPAPPEAA